MEDRVYEFENAIVRHEDFETLYETLIDRAQSLFRVMDSTRVQFAWGLNREEQAFYFVVHDDRLYYDYKRNEYMCYSADRVTFSLPDISWLLKQIDFFDVDSDIFTYYAINLRGGSPRRYVLVKRLKTDVRLIKIRVEDMDAALARIRAF